MFDISPNNLARERDQARETIKAHLDSLDDSVDRYVGRHYGRSRVTKKYQPENHEYEFVSLMVPRLVFANPKVKVTTRRLGKPAIVARSMHHGMNRWVEDEGYKSTLRTICVDFLLRWGVSITLPKQRKGRGKIPKPDGSTSEFPWVPTTKRLSTRDVYWDTLATDRSDLAFIGHRITRYKDDVLREARENPQMGWNVSAIESVPVNRKDDEPRNERRDRGEITYDVIWVRHHRLEGKPGPEEGFNGVVCTIATGSGGDNVELREPFPCYCPPWGPYTFYGAHVVPDETIPLSPVVPVLGQVEELNAAARAYRESVKRRKKIGVTNSIEEKIGLKFQKARDGDVIDIAGFMKDMIAEIELGGPSADQAYAIEMFKRTLANISGIDDAQRGAVTGRGTATENAIASQNAGVRTNGINDAWTDAVASNLKTVAWYLFHDNRVAMPVGPEAAMELGIPPEIGEDGAIYMPDPWLHGGMHEELSGFAFEDLELCIEPYSMERTSEGRQQQQLDFLLRFALEVAPAIPMNPHVRWQEWMQAASDLANQPLFARIVDMNVASQMSQMGMALQVQEAQAKSEGPKQEAYQGSAKPSIVIPPGAARGGRSTPVSGAKEKSKSAV
jgi:hypothetical protein